MEPTVLAQSLILADPSTVADLRTFVGRARAADDGAVRLQANGTILAAYVCLLRPRLLGEGTPTVLGLRTMALSEPAEADVTVPLAAVSDRLARMGERSTVLSLPPQELKEAWAGMSPPRGGWDRAGTLDGGVLLELARSGIAEVAAIIPDKPGALIVNNARAAVWGRPIDGLDPQVPAGAAFAAYALGFAVAGREIGVFRSARWTRLSGPGGHVLVRPAAVF
ncbi:MAG: hypothetical protein ACHP7K_06545 [Actinomycetales bacterium]